MIMEKKIFPHLYIATYIYLIGSFGRNDPSYLAEPIQNIKIPFNLKKANQLILKCTLNISVFTPYL